jgi:predicted transcriptional regulator
MSVTVTLTLDDETGAYLARMAADQGRTPAEVAAWIVTEDLRREQAIDADLLARLDEPLAADRDSPGGPQAAPGQVTQRERTGA